MQELFRRVTEQITEFWNKLTTKNRIMLIRGVAASIIALTILSLILSRTNYTLLASDVKGSDMTALTEELTAQNIAYELNDDATAVYVDENKIADASLIAVDVGVASDAMDYEDAISAIGLTTSNQVTEVLLKQGFENELAKDIEAMDFVRSAIVTVDLAKDSQSIVLKEDKESSVSIILDTVGEVTQDDIMAVVNYLKTAVPNLDDEISVATTNNLYQYTGETAESLLGAISNRTEYELRSAELIKSELKRVLLASRVYDDVEIAIELIVDFDEQKTTSIDYQDGPKTLEIEETSENSSTGTTGAPGTDSNSTTEYAISDTSEDSGSSSYSEIQYINDQFVTESIKSPGKVLNDQSSISVVLSQFNYVYEKTLNESGALDTISWEEYITSNANRLPTEIEVPDNIVEMVQTASGIDDVKVLAYSEPIFIPESSDVGTIINYVPVAVIVILILLLAYAVYKGTAPVEVEEAEPELSVEEMLATTKQTQELDPIEFDDKSATRQQIERFVDESPEAVALLLRNWLNEDWD